MLLELNRNEILELMNDDSKLAGKIDEALKLIKDKSP